MRLNRCPRCKYVAPIRGKCPHCTNTQKCFKCGTPIRFTDGRVEARRIGWEFLPIDRAKHIEPVVYLHLSCASAGCDTAIREGEGVEVGR